MDVFLCRNRVQPRQQQSCLLPLLYAPRSVFPHGDGEARAEKKERKPLLGGEVAEAERIVRSVWVQVDDPLVQRISTAREAEHNGDDPYPFFPLVTQERGRGRKAGAAEREEICDPHGHCYLLWVLQANQCRSGGSEPRQCSLVHLGNSSMHVSGHICSARASQGICVLPVL